MFSDFLQYHQMLQSKLFEYHFVNTPDSCVFGIMFIFIYSKVKIEVLSYGIELKPKE